MKPVQITLGGAECWLLYNIDAYLTLNAKYENVVEKINEGASAESVERLADCVAVMAEQGELLRRSLGYDKQRIVSADIVRATITPRRFIELRDAVMRAMVQGLAYDKDDDEDSGDIDLTLLELEKKTVKAV